MLYLTEHAGVNIPQGDPTAALSLRDQIYNALRSAFTFMAPESFLLDLADHLLDCANAMTSLLDFWQTPDLVQRLHARLKTEIDDRNNVMSFERLGELTDEIMALLRAEAAAPAASNKPGVQADNTPFMRLISISYGKNTLLANIRVHVPVINRVKAEKVISFPPDGKSLAEQTGLTEYTPYVIDRIDMAWQKVEFTNGFVLTVPNASVPVSVREGFSAVGVVDDLPTFTGEAAPAETTASPQALAEPDSLEAYSSLPQSFIGRVNVVGDCYCFGVVVERRPPTYKSIPVYISVAGPATSVEALWAKLSQGKETSVVPEEKEKSPIYLEPNKGGLFARYQKKIEHLGIDHMILVQHDLAEPSYPEAGDKEFGHTYVLCMSQAQRAAKLGEHVRKTVKVAVFDEWFDYLYREGCSKGLVRKCLGYGVQAISVQLDPVKWTQVISEGLLHKHIQFPRSAED